MSPSRNLAAFAGAILLALVLTLLVTMHGSPVSKLLDAPLQATPEASALAPQDPSAVAPVRERRSDALPSAGLTEEWSDALSVDLGSVVPGASGIEGRIFGGDGAPLANPVVWFHSKDSTGGGEGMPDGTFRVRSCPAGEPCELRLGDTAARFVHVSLAAVLGGTRNLVVRLLPAKQITLVVRDERGPVEEFQVAWQAERPIRWPFADSTNPHADGRMIVTIPGRSIRYRIESRGHATLLSDPVRGDAPPAGLALSLRSLPALRGRVLGNGGPVSGAELQLLPRDRDFLTRCDSPYWCRFGTLDSHTSDADGSFVLYQAYPTEQFLTVEAKGYARFRLGPFPFEKDGRSDLAVQLDPGGTLEGKVLMPPGRSPERVELSLRCGEEWGHNQQVGADGAFRFEHVKAGIWALHRVRENRLWTMETTEGDELVTGASSGKLPYPSMEVVITSGGTTHADFDLCKAIPCVLDLDVTNNEAPAVSWTVSARNPHISQGSEPYARVGLDGHARLEVEDPGPCRLTFRPTGNYPEFEYSAEIKLERGRNVLRQDIPSARVEGSIAGDPGAASNRWSLRYTESGPGWSKGYSFPLQPNSRGRFIRAHVKPGPVDITHLVGDGADMHEVLFEHLELAAGETRTLELH